MKRHSWKNIEKAEFLIRIGHLLDQGYTIPDSLELFLKYEKEKLKPMLKQILEELKRGSSFSESLVKLDIPKSIISFVYFSEHYGNLARGLVDGGDLLRKTEENKIKLQKIIKYPLFLFWVLIVFFVVMYQYLFPQFILLFSTINIPLPLLTRIFLSALEWMPLFFLLILILVFILLIYFFSIFQRKPILQKAVTICKIPIIGCYYQMLITYFFSQNLSCLVKNGMAIYDALILFKDHESFGYISKISEKLISKLEKGETLQQVLLSETVYLSGLAYIVEHGHSRGRLDEELDYFSKWVLSEVEERLKKQFMIVQPVLFLFIGIIVLVMFASILIPIFTLINGL